MTIFGDGIYLNTVALLVVKCILPLNYILVHRYIIWISELFLKVFASIV